MHRRQQSNNKNWIIWRKTGGRETGSESSALHLRVRNSQFTMQLNSVVIAMLTLAASTQRLPHPIPAFVHSRIRIRERPF